MMAIDPSKFPLLFLETPPFVPGTLLFYRFKQRVVTSSPYCRGAPNAELCFFVDSLPSRPQVFSRLSKEGLPALPRPNLQVGRPDFPPLFHRLAFATESLVLFFFVTQDWSTSRPRALNRALTSVLPSLRRASSEFPLNDLFLVFLLSLWVSHSSTASFSPFVD